jgi:hypothetical protein
MPLWLIFAVLLTVAVTALLTAALYRINLPGEAASRSGPESDAAPAKEGP